MKFLIAGLGSIGRRHLRNLVHLGEKDILLFRTHQSSLPDNELSDFLVETELHSALSQRPDAVIVTNPTALHLDIAIPAAEAGCHLFLEKPISHSIDRVDQLQTAVHQGGGKVLVGFQFRFHPGLQKIAHLLSEGAIGHPLSVRAHWGEYLPVWHPWEDYRQSYSARSDLGGGVILTLCHPLDYLRWLFGEVESVWAFAGKLSDLEVQVEDIAEIGLRFSNGVLGSIHLDYVQRPPTHRLEVVGTQGTIRWDNADGAVRIYSVPPLSPVESQYENWKTFPLPEGFERNDLFLAEMRNFLAITRGEGEPVCTLDDGIRALQLALAAHQSVQRGQLVEVRRTYADQTRPPA